MQQKSSRWPWAVAVVVVIAAGWWLFRANLSPPSVGKPPAFPSQTHLPLTPPEAGTAAPAAPAIQHPIAAADPAAADAAIPPLADSDAAAWEALQALLGDHAVLEVLLREHLVERLVAMVDNLPQPSIGRQALALRALPGTLAVEQADGGATTISASNAQRYAPWVAAFTAADPQALAGAYRRFYPLFQQAYVGLGYPTRYFNDRLVQVIDHLLQAPEPAAPIAVSADARGKYRFDDPALEALSVGQKALVRLGAEQERAVKQQLRAVRAAITRG